MKNKTIKTITCLLAGLTLTACVGTLNLSSNTLDTERMAKEARESTGVSGTSGSGGWNIVNGGRVGNVNGNYILINGGRAGNVNGDVIVINGRAGNIIGNAIVHSGGRVGNVSSDATVYDGRTGNVDGDAKVYSNGRTGNVSGDATVRDDGRVGNVGGNLSLHGRGRAGNAGNSGASVRTKNLTLGDLPPFPAYLFYGIDADEPEGDCVSSTKICRGIIPIVIDIKPLNNNNDSSATYNGSVSVSYFNEAGTIRDITENIAIDVDFDDNEISHSSTIDTNLFSIDGVFNSTGQITGNVTYDTVQGNLIGLIGQTDMIGIFGGKAGGFGGGFTATRQ